MATRIRTLNFLPEIFKTTTNSQFLNATLDQIVDQPNTKKIEGYIGSRFGYGVNAKNYYVTEPTKVRTDYQLDPGVTFLKKDTSTAQDFISYPGIIDGLKLEGAVVNDNNRFQNSQFWIQGAPGVTGADPTQPNVSTRDILGVSNNGAETGVVEFTVPYKNAQDQYNFPGNNRVDLVTTLPYDSVNGVLVSELTNGIDGITSLNGLTLMFYNNGNISVIEAGDFVIGNTYKINTIGTTDFTLIGATTNTVGESFIATGVGTGTGTAIGLTGYVSKFYDTTLYDEETSASVAPDGGAPYTPPGDDLNFANFEGGYYTDIASTFYTITYEGDPTDPVIRLVDSGTIPSEERITANFGTQWIGRSFYRNTSDTISLIPYLSAILDTLYYQDGTSGNKLGTITLISSNTTNRINILTDIIGKANCVY